MCSYSKCWGAKRPNSAAHFKEKERIKRIKNVARVRACICFTFTHVVFGRYEEVFAVFQPQLS